MQMTETNFMCPNCGKEGLPVWRKSSCKREKFHRKRMYCMTCKQEINFIEVRNLEEKIEFTMRYNNGEFKEEAAKSLEFCKGSW